MLRFILFLSVCFFLNRSFSQTIYQVAVIGFYNLENFYDTLDNPLVNDDDFTPGGLRNYNSAVYWKKVENLARVIAQMGTEFSPDGPAILGVAEIENDTVLNDLVRHKFIRHRNYQIVHYDSKDIRGVDVALLYNPKYFSVLASQKLFVPLPEGAKSSIFTRDVLFVKGLLLNEEVHIFVNHWPSRLGGEERSAPGRAAAAMVNKRFADSLLHLDLHARIVIMGDLNDDPVSSSITKVLKAKSKITEVREGELYNPWTAMYKKGIGTLAYRDAWGLFDQIILSSGWLNQDQDGFFYKEARIFNKEFLKEDLGKYKGYPMRTWDGMNFRGGYSDHFPTYVVLLRRIRSP